MTRFPALLIALATISTLACGGDVLPVLVDRPGGPTILDSIAGDSVLAYHPTLADSGVVLPPPADTTSPLPPPADTTPAAPPIAGRRFVSAERLATWNGMKAGNHPMWEAAVATCGTLGTGTERYGDNGMFCAIVATVNNDAAAAAKAITKLKAWADPNASPDNIRQYFTADVVMLDLLAPWVTVEDKAFLTPVYDKWASKSAGLRSDDTDAIVGEGIGAILWDIYNGRTPNRPNVFAALPDIMAMAAGGQWMESSQYNTNTLQLLAMGNLAYRGATGRDVVPSIGPTLLDVGKVQALEVTPDLNAGLQWADDDSPRGFAYRIYQRVAFLGTSAHPYAQSLVAALITKYPVSQTATGLMANGLFAWRTDVAGQPTPEQVTHVASGMGQLYRRDGQIWQWATGMNNVAADHGGYFGPPFDVQVYRNGWLLTHPIAYASVSKAAENVVNGPLYAGLSFFNVRRMAWTATGTNWSAIAGTVRGNFWATTWPAPSDPFLDIGHRVTVLATINGQPVVIVRDSVKMVDPRTSIRGLDQFYNNGTYQHGATVVEYDGAPWSIWHVPVNPTITGNRVSWTAATGDPVSLWLDGQVAVNSIDENAVYADDGVSVAEKKWQVRVRHNGVLWQVWGTGTPTVSRAGSTITVNGKAFTITSSGVTGG
ncbi:MAG: hypothetical protein ABIR59_02940 [Gemmatimonadales bacterium]